MLRRRRGLPAALAGPWLDGGLGKLAGALIGMCRVDGDHSVPPRQVPTAQGPTPNLRPRSTRSATIWFSRPGPIVRTRTRRWSRWCPNASNGVFASRPDPDRRRRAQLGSPAGAPGDHTRVLPPLREGPRLTLWQCDAENDPAVPAVRRPARDGGRPRLSGLRTPGRHDLGRAAQQCAGVQPLPPLCPAREPGPDVLQRTARLVPPPLGDATTRMGQVLTQATACRRYPNVLILPILGFAVLGTVFVVRRRWSAHAGSG